MKFKFYFPLFLIASAFSIPTLPDALYGTISGCTELEDFQIYAKNLNGKLISNKLNISCNETVCYFGGPKVIDSKLYVYANVNEQYKIYIGNSTFEVPVLTLVKTSSTTEIKKVEINLFDCNLAKFLPKVSSQTITMIQTISINYHTKSPSTESENTQNTNMLNVASTNYPMSFQYYSTKEVQPEVVVIKENITYNKTLIEITTEEISSKKLNILFILLLFGIFIMFLALGFVLSRLS